MDISHYSSQHPRPNAKAIRLLSPGTATQSSNYSHQPQVRMAVLFSCSSHNLHVCVFSHYISQRYIVALSVQSSECVFSTYYMSSMEFMPDVYSDLALKLLVGRWKNAHADTLMLSTMVGSVREDEHIHWLILLCGVLSKTQ